MTLNGEEKYRQAQYEIEQSKRRQEADEREIEMLQDSLEHSQNTINYLNNHIDKLVEQRDQVNGAINLYVNGDRTEGINLDSIRSVMRYG